VLRQTQLVPKLSTDAPLMAHRTPVSGQLDTFVLGVQRSSSGGRLIWLRAQWAVGHLLSLRRFSVTGYVPGPRIPRSPWIPEQMANLGAQHLGIA